MAKNVDAVVYMCKTTGDFIVFYSNMRTTFGKNLYKNMRPKPKTLGELCIFLTESCEYLGAL